MKAWGYFAGSRTGAANLQRKLPANLHPACIFIAHPPSKEGLPLRTAPPLSNRVRQACRSRPARVAARRITSHGASREPQSKRGSSPRMPATAAIDNETLDHLLSVVTGRSRLRQIRALSKNLKNPGGRRRGSRLRAQRLAQRVNRERRHGLAQKPPHHLHRGGAVLPLRGIVEQRGTERMLGQARPF
jgi:hypothetical protein